MAEPTDIDAHKARQELQDAETALTRLRAALLASRTGKMDFALLRKIGGAEERVAAARDALRKIDPMFGE